MRVAIVAECFLPEVNGVTNSVLRILERLPALGHDVMVMAPGPGPVDVDGVPVVRVASLPLPVYRSLRVALPTRRVRDALADFGADVVHLAAPVVLGAAGARAAAALGRPAIAVFQTDVVGFARRYRLRATTPVLWSWLRHVHGSVQVTLAPSTSAAWSLRAHGIGPVEIWSRGVDTERFAPAHRTRAFGRERPVVGYVGRLAAEKRVHLLADVCARNEARVVIVGDGPAKARLQRRLRGAAFLGFQSGIALSSSYASLDVFVHTGSDETFCQAVQEALASGVPVVAPAVGGPLDLVQHGHNGYLYAPGDAGQLAEAVSTLVNDRRLRRRMSRAARASVERRDWDTVINELVDHYLSVVDRPPLQLAA